MDSCLVLTECFCRRILPFMTSTIDLIHSERVSTSTSSFFVHRLAFSSHASMIMPKCWCHEYETGSLYFGPLQLRTVARQNRSTEGCSKLKRSVNMTSSGKNCLNIRTNASPNGTGPGVRRSKRPLLASRTRFNVLWKPRLRWGILGKTLKVELLQTCIVIEDSGSNISSIAIKDAWRLLSMKVRRDFIIDVLLMRTVANIESVNAFIGEFDIQKRTVPCFCRFINPDNFE